MSTVHDDNMNEQGYLGMLNDERRLVLVPVDPNRPWAAFRRMRAWMKRARPVPARASDELFAGDDRTPDETHPAEELAEVIQLRRRRRTN